MCVFVTDAKEQILANLANFAYDPINYQWLRRLKVIDLFLHQLAEGTPTPLQRFAAAGICNLCLGNVSFYIYFF